MNRNNARVVVSCSANSTTNRLLSTPEGATPLALREIQYELGNQKESKNYPQRKQGKCGKQGD